MEPDTMVPGTLTSGVYAAPLSSRHRYNVARLTLRYLAISLAA
jgi:hypothetical protein